MHAQTFTAFHLCIQNEEGTVLVYTEGLIRSVAWNWLHFWWSLLVNILMTDSVHFSISKDLSLLMPNMNNNVSETDLVSETLHFLVFRVPDNGQSPETRSFWNRHLVQCSFYSRTGSWLTWLVLWLNFSITLFLWEIHVCITLFCLTQCF
jgi:hypothetical protein